MRKPKQPAPIDGFFPYNEIKLQLIPRLINKDLQPFTSSKDAEIFCREIYDPGTISFYESAHAIFLNRQNKVIGFYKLSEGGLTGTVVDPRKIFVAALQVQAVSIMLTHNHPSGNLKPSRQDEELTRKVKEAGVFLDIKLIDHLIISEDGYFSFADEGILY